jgi:CheY-like chemotaxis protein
MLKALGEHAVVASDGEQALDRCRTLHPTMVLMDVQMPRLDGIEATRALRALQATGDVAPCPIVVASAMLDERVGTACHEAGVDVSLPKPIELGALRTQIERFCPPGP